MPAERRVSTPEDMDALDGLDDAEAERFTFRLSAREVANFKEWLKVHDAECRIRDTDTAAGGRFTFSFTKGTIGDPVSVGCACGATMEITDFSGW